MNNRHSAAGGLLRAAGLALLIGLVGCEDKQQPLSVSGSTPNSRDSAPEETAPPPPAPEPEQEEREERSAPAVDALAGLELDPKVVFPRINEPSSTSIAEAVAALAGAIARGDSRELHPMLDTPNQVILDELVETGVWQASTESISNVRVCSLEDDGQSVRVGLGIEDDNGAYLLGWSGERVGGSWLFSGIALDTPAFASNAAELDGGSISSRPIPEPGAIIEEDFDPTINDPRREGSNNNRRRGSRRGGPR